MAIFSFNIPKSLSTYIEQFNDDPVKVTTKLKTHLQKRGPDAVGYFILACFYHLKGVRDQAVHYALKAKTYAPGSPLMENLHYYLSHPRNFDAWEPQYSSDPSTKKYRTGDAHDPVLNLDTLIERLSEVESGRVDDPESEKKSIYSFDLSELEHDVDDIASETLANIHETQGKTEAAIRTYKLLKKLNKEKEEFYKEQISRLQKLREEQDGDGESHEQGEGEDEVKPG